MPGRHHDVNMRTTLTLDPDVAKLIEDRVHEERISMKRVVNAALRRGLTEPGSGEARPYRMTTFPGQVRAGIDTGSMNRLADELEDAELIHAQSP